LNSNQCNKGVVPISTRRGLLGRAKQSSPEPYEVSCTQQRSVLWLSWSLLLPQVMAGHVFAADFSQTDLTDPEMIQIKSAFGKQWHQLHIKALCTFERVTFG